jgi:hypothetical protein
MLIMLYLAASARARPIMPAASTGMSQSRSARSVSISDVCREVPNAREVVDFP